MEENTEVIEAEVVASREQQKELEQALPAEDNSPCRYADHEGFCCNPNMNCSGSRCCRCDGYERRKYGRLYCFFKDAPGNCTNSNMPGNIGKPCSGCNEYDERLTRPVPVEDPLPKTLPIITHGKVVNVDASRALTYQFNRCNKAMGSATMEMCRFGAMLEAIDDGLTKQRFTNADKGSGTGMSLKAWMEKNCPDIPYHTAKSYQYAAKGIRNMMQLAADRPLLPLMGVQPIAEEEQEELRKKIIETVTGSSLNILRRAAMPQEAGNALKGTHGMAGGRRALTAEEKSAEAEKMMRELVGQIGAYLRGPWFDMLSDRSQDDFVGSLKHYVETMNERIAER